MNKNKARGYSRAQQKLREEFCKVYGFAPDQIGFSGTSLDPIFDFDSLNVLANTLADIPEISVELNGFNELRGMANSVCEITLHGNRKRKIFGVGIIGEVLHDGTKIAGMKQAIDVSRSRCLRTGLRAIGFDPVRAHELNQKGQTIDLLGSAKKELAKKLAEIHVLAGPQGLNLIKRGNDRAEYENLLASYFAGRTSSKDLEPQEVAEWLGMLRAWARRMEQRVA